MIEKYKLEALHFEWYVTFDKENQDLPSYVEAIMMQRYFEIYRELPLWNKSF